VNRASGRDHWPYCFSYLIAGGGIPGGRVIGASDKFAAYPAEQPVSPEQTAASMLGLAGLDLGRLRRMGVVRETKGIEHLFG